MYGGDDAFGALRASVAAHPPPAPVDLLGSVSPELRARAAALAPSDCGAPPAPRGPAPPLGGGAWLTPDAPLLAGLPGAELRLSPEFCLAAAGGGGAGGGGGGPAAAPPSQDALAPALLGSIGGPPVALTEARGVWGRHSTLCARRGVALASPAQPVSLALFSRRVIDRRSWATRCSRPKRRRRRRSGGG